MWGLNHLPYMLGSQSLQSYVVGTDPGQWKSVAGVSVAPDFC